MKPSFIGLGAQKCASSWLHAIFADHPQAFVSNPKELDFFSYHFGRGYQWYEGHFDAVGSQQMAVGEISPSYLPSPEAPARAMHYNSDFRIVVALRDPVERAYSNFLHDLRLGYYQSAVPSFEAALLNNPMYVEQSMYARHLRRWMDFFAPDRFLIILQEEINDDPAREARNVYRFLDIDCAHSTAAISRRSNESYLPKSKARETQIRAIGSFLRRNHLTWVDTIARSTGVVASIQHRNRLDIRSVVPPMLQCTRERLSSMFASDLRELATIMNRGSLPWPTWHSSHSRPR